MEDYPRPYVAWSRPLVALSGLERAEPSDLPRLLSNGSRIGSSLPPLDASREEDLKRAFMQFDFGQDAAHRDLQAQQRSPLLSFHIKPCGRTITLPCRKASPLASEVGTIRLEAGSAHLHSPLSPLTNGSPIYVDGIMTPLWPMKYHDAVPAVIVFFFHIGFDTHKDVLNDNHLKAEINSIKVNLADSNYKTKAAVVLVGENSMRQCPEVEERLANIRKAVKLESKTTFFYLPPQTSEAALTSFAEGVLSAVRLICQEFYKAHYKQSRRKKDTKGDSNPSTPSAEGISQNLPKSGWNVRYEYKMGVFSEFRLEPEAAARHYKEVLDLLMGQDGLFYSYATWSPRWNELRLLADSSALRRIRCLLMSGLTTAAAAFWDSYRDGTRNLLERKGTGSSTYSWHAWVARFAKCMAQTIQSSLYMVTDSAARKSLEVLTKRQQATYALAEKSSQSDALRPWHLLHHPGYWLYLSARSSGRRGALAKAIPSEDLVPPEQSPAANVARRSQVYDTYLCPEPHVEGKEVDHRQGRLETLESAIVQFEERNQHRMADRLRFDIGASVKTNTQFDDSLLEPLWQKNTWRRAGWDSILQHLAYDLFVRARQSGDFRTQILMIWELLGSREFYQRPVCRTSLDESRFKRCPIGSIYNAHWLILCYNLGAVQTEVAALDLNALMKEASNAASPESPTTFLEINDGDISSFLDLDFVFKKEAENLGEVVRAQIILKSNAHLESKPVTLTELIFTFKGSLPNIRIHNSSTRGASEGRSSITEVELQDAAEETDYLQGISNLTLFPEQTRVMTMALPLRESGKIVALDAVAVLEEPQIRLQYAKTLGLGRHHNRWHVSRQDRLRRQRRARWTSYREVNILPKLPKLKIRLPDLADEYYVGEETVVTVELVNEEDWVIDGSLRVRMSANGSGSVQPQLLHNEESDEGDTQGSSVKISRIELLTPSSTVEIPVSLQMPSEPSEEFSLEVEVEYNGGRDKDSRVSKTMSTKIVIAEPIHASFTVSPEVHLTPWPSYFALSEISEDANEQSKGLYSRWNLQVSLAGLAKADLLIEDVKLSLQELDETTASSIISEVNKSGNLAHGENHEALYQIDVLRHSLDDTSPSMFDPTLTIHWRRQNSAGNNRFKKVLAAPRLTLPTSEPRVIATRAASDDERVMIDLHLENPSMHFLSFEYGISSSDDFGFSGSTLATAHLVPMSRHRVRYTLVPLVRGAYITPMFKVLDVFYNKSLRVNAGSGLQRESAGNLLIWIDSER